MPVSYFHGLRAHDGVEGTELEATVRDGSSEGHAENSAEGKEALGASSRHLRQTNKPSKVSFPSQHPKQGAFGRSPEDTRS